VSRSGIRREASIDVLRAAAIAIMVLVHFVENLSAHYGESSGSFQGIHRAWWLPMGFAAPMFAFLSGVSYRLWLAGRERRGWTERVIAKSTIRRGLFLIGLGFAFNVLVWLPQDIFNWDILTLIGCGILALEVARRMPEQVVVLAAVLVIAVAPAMRNVAGYPEFWLSGSFDHDFTLADVVLGWLVTGYFPIFPWLAFPLLGFAAAPWLLSGSWRPVPLGAALVAASASIVAAWPAMPRAATGGAVRAWTMFPASTAYVLGTLGGTVLAMTVLHWLLDGDKPRGRWLVSWATPLSRHSLSIYLLHHVVHVWPLWAYGLATTGIATSLWQRAAPPAVAVSLAAAFVIAAAVLCRGVERWHIPTAESFMRWLCD
jgi:uncharacterized membrane protein